MQMESVACKLQKSLGNCAHIRSSQLVVLELSDELVIRGKVNTFYQKQMAQEEAIACLKVLVPDGITLRNEIVVDRQI